MSRPLTQYLERHAEPEKDLPPPAGWNRVAIVPSLGEGALVGRAVESILAAGGERDGVIVVLNARASHTPETHAANEVSRKLLEGLDGSRVRIVDRALPGRFLPEKEGVGLARKIGNDVALAWWGAGAIDSPLFFQTDADAVVPRDWFDRIDAADPAAAWTCPFRHRAIAPVSEGDLHLYELWLRSHRLGLAEAGSPYAFQAIGSTIVVRATAYAAARGFRRTEAGEDFYLLDKMAKLGSVRALGGAPIVLEGRLSDRVPFGTGRAMRDRQEVPEGEERLFPDPEGYRLLKAWLETLESIVVEPSRAATFDRSLPLGILESMGALRFVRESAAMNILPAVRRRRLHTWFDAFRTLRFLHLVRDRLHPPRPWREALAGSPWLGGTVRERVASGSSPGEVLEALIVADESSGDGTTAGLP